MLKKKVLRKPFEDEGKRKKKTKNLGTYRKYYWMSKLETWRKSGDTREELTRRQETMPLIHDDILIMNFHIYS